MAACSLGAAPASAHHNDWAAPLVGGALGGYALGTLVVELARSPAPRRSTSQSGAGLLHARPVAAPYTRRSRARGTIEAQLNQLDKLAAAGYITPAEYQDAPQGDPEPDVNGEGLRQASVWDQFDPDQYRQFRTRLASLSGSPSCARRRGRSRGMGEEAALTSWRWPDHSPISGRAARQRGHRPSRQSGRAGRSRPQPTGIEPDRHRTDDSICNDPEDRHGTCTREVASAKRGS